MSNETLKGFPPGYDESKGVRVIDGIPHRFYPPKHTDSNRLLGPWCWKDKNGLNKATRGTFNLLNKDKTLDIVKRKRKRIKSIKRVRLMI